MSESAVDRREFLTCSICLDIYKDPKLLPCGHTFCKVCLEGWVASNLGTSFQCPFCKRETKLPANGVSGFPNNFHILPQDLERARNWELCLAHDKVVEFYCNRCSESLCINCKLTVHEGHPTRDLREAAVHAKGQLEKDKSRLSSSVIILLQRLEKGQEKRTELDGLQKDLEKQIRQRHATVLKEADRARDKALASLTKEIQTEKDKVVDVKGIEGSVKELRQLQVRVNQALASSKSDELLTVAREMTYGRGSVSTIKTLTSFKVGSFEHLHLLSTGSYGELKKRVTDFIGVAGHLPKVNIETKKMFNCASGNNERRVFSLCHEDSEDAYYVPNVIVSYEQLGECEEAQVVFFDESGIQIGSETKVKNTRSYKRWSRGQCSFAQSDVDKVDTYAKNMVTTAHYRLVNSLRGTATLCSVTLPIELFCSCTTITVGTHRAVDIDNTERALVVVEEAKTVNEKRKVLMYRPPGRTPVATYTPPTPTFQPSDVCFYTLGGQQVLLVSDEANNAIHVVSVGEDSLTFVRFLTNNCPSLVCPTAMNIDVLGRLWVACKGGNILTMQPRQ